MNLSYRTPGPPWMDGRLIFSDIRPALLMPSLLAVVAIITLVAAFILAIRRNSRWACLGFAIGWFLVACCELQILVRTFTVASAPPGVYSQSVTTLAWVLAIRITQITLFLSIPTIVVIGIQNQSKSLRIAALILAVTSVVFSVALSVARATLPD